MIETAYKFLLLLQKGSVEIKKSATILSVEEDEIMQYIKAARAAGINVEIANNIAKISTTWMPVIDNPRYEVSESGVVRNVRTKTILKNNNGLVSLMYFNTLDGKKYAKTCTVARLLYEAFHGQRVDEVIEKIDPLAGTTLSNLRLGKRKANPQTKGYKPPLEISPKKPLDSPVTVDGYTYFPNGNICVTKTGQWVKTYTDNYGLSMVMLNNELVYRTVALWTAYYGIPIGRIKRRDGDNNNYAISNLYI